MRRLVVLLALAASIPALAVLPRTEPAHAASSAPATSFAPADEQAYVTHINAVRQANGLKPLTLDVNMRSSARQWTKWMANNQTLQHADDIVTGAPADWLKVGENVGRGGSVDSVWDAFMASPGHAANVLDPDYDLVGVGVMWTSDGRIYTTHRFAATESGGTEHSATPAKEPSPAGPRPTPAPEPAAPSNPPAAAPAQPEPTAPQPDRLPFGDAAPVAPPARPERVAATMALLLAAGA